MTADLTDPIEFIKTLKSQHKSIISTIHDIDNQHGGVADLKSSVDKLNKVTALLFDHLEKEDKQLYPALINSKETEGIGKKYFYDMERLSCIALDFFKRYCVNREGLKIFVEDFVNGYSLFSGLLKTRIKREETELYPAFILLQSGVLYSDVVEYINQKQAISDRSQKRVFIYSQNQPSLDAIGLSLEILGFQVMSAKSPDKASYVLENVKSDLILLDVSKTNKELIDLIGSLKNDKAMEIPLVAYSTSSNPKFDDSISNKFDYFITKPAVEIEAFSERVKQILYK